MTRLLISFIVALALFPVFAEPVTYSRLNTQPTAELSAWKNYLERSQTNALTDAAVVQAEVAAHKVTNALRAPSGGDFKVHTNIGDAWFAGDEAKQLADAILYDTFAAMAAQNKLGYDYYTSQPGSIVKTARKKWRKMLAAASKK